MKVYILGDSISIRYGPFLQQYLKGVIDYARKGGEEEALKNLDIPQGANCGDSVRVLSILKSMADAGGIDADVLLVNCGLHDIKKEPKTGKYQVPLDEYQQNLKSIVALAASQKPQMVWVSTTPVVDALHNKPTSNFHRHAVDCDAYNAAADAIMTEAGIPVIDLYTFTQNIGTELYFDHVHFLEPVMQKQGAFIAGWLNAYQALKG